MRVCFYTLGCKVNQNETGALAQLFEQNGFTVVEEKDGADVYCRRRVLPLIFFCVGGGALSEWADSIIILIER